MTKLRVRPVNVKIGRGPHDNFHLIDEVLIFFEHRKICIETFLNSELRLEMASKDGVLRDRKVSTKYHVVIFPINACGGPFTGLPAPVELTRRVAGTLIP